MAWTCPVCRDLNPACLVMTCEERAKSRAKRLGLTRRPMKNVTPKPLRLTTS